MTNVMILAIAVAVLLAAILVLVLVWVYERRFDKMRREIAVLRYEVEMRDLAEEDPDPIYKAAALYPNYPGYVEGAWYVYRLSCAGGIGMVKTTVKVLSDEDEDFNRREAEELCEILNAR